jgi:hypothetical protein
MSTMLRGKNLIIFLPLIDEKYTTRIFSMFLVHLKIFYQFKLTLDNNILHEFHPYFFSIKDHITRRIMFRVHVMVASTAMPLSIGPSKQVFIIIKLSSWHRRLGDPSSFVVQHIFRKHHISYSPKINPYIFYPCQLAKSYQLPYHVSTSVFVVHLEQVFSDVWVQHLY